MKHRERLTNPIALELAFPVGGGRVLQRLHRHSWEPISTPQLLQLPSKTESPSSCRPPASPMIQTHGGTSKIHANISMPIRPAAVERFSPIHFAACGITAALAPASAMSPEANSNRFSFSLVTRRCKRPNATSDAGRTSEKRSTIDFESHPQSMQLISLADAA